MRVGHHMFSRKTNSNFFTNWVLHCSAALKTITNMQIIIGFDTGTSFSEALILASVNPQYDERLFIELQEKYKFRTCCVQILFWMSKQKQTKKPRAAYNGARTVTTY